MKKSTKALSVALSALMVTSSVAVGAAVIANAADESKYIYFEVPTLEEWGTTKNVYCHLYAVYGNKTDLLETSWQSKKEQCKAANKEKTIYYFDTSTVGEIEAGADYALLFSTKDSDGVAHQTGNLTFGIDCLGDTVYLTGDKVENTEDSEKMDFEGAWRKNYDKYGAKKGITSTGKIVGKYFPVNQPKSQILAIALKQYLPAPEDPRTVNEGFFKLDNNLSLCDQLGTTPLEVYRQYEADYADKLAEGDGLTPLLSTVQERLGLTEADLNPTEPPTEAPTEAPTTKAPVVDPTEAPTTPVDPGVDPTEAPTTPVNPGVTEPTEAPAPTQPAPTQPAPTQPAPTQPAPTQPAPTQPVEPKPTEPGVTNPTENPAPAMIGDMSGDGVVDAKDRILLTRYLAKWAGYENQINLDAADVNHDGVVDAKDRIKLTRYLAKWKGYETLD